MSRRITVNAAARQSQNSTMTLRLSVQRRSLPVESGRSAVLVLRPARLSRTGFDGDHQANREQDRMSAPRKYPDELRQRAVRLVRDAGAEPGTSRKEACRRVGQQLGISPETLRGWVNRAEIDDGDKPGVTTETAARIAELERENRELRRANAILKSASAFFAAELDRPSR
jgi:transposase